ncbi:MULTISPECIES: patatin-like phospholipase family protein [unclassified Nocardioides]|uniref:patatin-like phospholipase family protein n=1 Tax=unclassified Nocardioides TaxID=2615069 RepID=UPI000056F29E|nr:MULTISPECIES: patatin-like phospholipase family protein [unclassified Nocardioides]ABL81594.1 Patatin [Nocardioides sp. JS614]
MTTAFVLSGGANLGAAQVGMLAALDEAGVIADLVVGSSVGAVNGAWVAGHGDLAALGDVWRSLRRADVFPARPLDGLLGFVGMSDHLVSDRGLRRLLRAHLRFDRLEDAAVPLHVVATDIRSGEDVLLSTGDAVDAILASAAIPGVLPPVAVDGRTLVDGGVVNNAPISHALDLGAGTIWVLATGYSCALEHPPGSALAVALQAASLMIHQRLLRDVERYAGAIDLRVVPPLCPISVGPTDFSQADDLIRRAHEHARAWLEHGERGTWVSAHTDHQPEERFSPGQPMTRRADAPRLDNHLSADEPVSAMRPSGA